MTIIIHHSFILSRRRRRHIIIIDDDDDSSINVPLERGDGASGNGRAREHDSFSDKGRGVKTSVVAVEVGMVQTREIRRG